MCMHTWMHARENSMSRGVADCTELPDLCVENVCENLEQRQAEVYTWMGSLLVAVNPLEPRPALYDDECKRRFAGKSINFKDPHIYAVSENFYRWCTRRHSGQATAILAGESGSGKTETARHLIEYLVWRTGSTQNRLKMDASNLVLEAFGNAKTVNNNNSSRFGKLTNLNLVQSHPSPHGSESELSISHVHLETYLLARNRLTHLLPNEQTFHIFHSVFHDQEFIRKNVEPSLFSSHVSTSSTSAYRLPPLQFQADGLVYFEGEKVRSALAALGFTSEETITLWRFLLGILYLATISFKSRQAGEFDGIEGEPHVHGEDSVITNPETLEASALCLGCDSHMLAKALTSIKILTSVRTLAEVDCRKTRDSLIGHMYQSLFKYLVEKINVSLGRKECEGQKRSENGGTMFVQINALDIYGFEVEPINGVEQLMINGANEKLQKSFLTHLVLNESQVQFEEGLLSSSSADASANDDIEKQLDNHITNLTHIFGYLHDSSFAPIQESARDGSFLQALKSNKNLTFVTKIDGFKGAFTFNHFAAPVVYTTSGFCEHNLDSLTKDCQQVLELSTFCKALSGSRAQTSPDAEHSAPTRSDFFSWNRNRRWKSLGLHFWKLIDELCSRLDESALQMFVRCIKPNVRQIPATFDHECVRSQLHHGGISIVLRSMKLGYPTRIMLKDFEAKVLKFVARPKIIESNHRDFLQAVLHILGIPSDQVYIGIQRILFKHQWVDKIDSILSEKSVDISEQTLTTYWAQNVLGKKKRRVCIAIKFCALLSTALKQKKAVSLIQRNFRRFIVRVRLQKLKAAVTFLQCRWRYRRMRACVRIQSILRQWIAKVKAGRRRQALLALQRAWRSQHSRTFAATPSTTAGVDQDHADDGILHEHSHGEIDDSTPQDIRRDSDPPTETTRRPDQEMYRPPHRTETPRQTLMHGRIEAKEDLERDVEFLSPGHFYSPDNSTEFVEPVRSPGSIFSDHKESPRARNVSVKMRGRWHRQMRQHRGKASRSVAPAREIVLMKGLPPVVGDSAYDGGRVWSAKDEKKFKKQIARKPSIGDIITLDVISDEERLQ